MRSLDEGGPESTAWCPYKTRGIWTLAERMVGGDRHAHRGHVKMEENGKDAATSQGPARMAGSH